MHQLPEPVLSEFKRGNFVVKRSAHKFSQADPDQAMEWINGTGKKGGGIIGITKTISALFRWTLSFNLISHNIGRRNTFILRYSRTNLKAMCISVWGVKLYNALPANMKEIIYRLRGRVVKGVGHLGHV